MQAAALGKICARAGARLVDEGGKPDPEQNAPSPQAGLLAPERGIVGDRQQAIEQRRWIAGIVHPPSRRGIWKFTACDQIAPTHLDHVDAEFASAKLDQPLVGPGRLRTARAAIGVDRHGVGVDAAHPQMEIRGLVEASDRLRIGIAGDAGRKVAEIAAQRRERVDLHRDDASIAIETHAGGGVVVARLRVGEKCFGAGRGPFDRAPQQLRGPHHRRHFDREISLDPEGAADIGRNDPDFMFGNVQRVDREPAPQVVRLLGGGIERVAIARGVVIAQIGARLDRIGRQTVVVEAELHDLRHRGHRRLGLAAVPALDLEHQIAVELFVHERRARRHGVTRGGDRGQRVVRDLHRFGRVLGG